MQSLKTLIRKRFFYLTSLIILLFTTIVSAQQGDDTTVYLPVITGNQTVTGVGDWPTVAANPQRTSWTPTEVTGLTNVEWYRPIEAYIPQNVQIIAAHGLLYLSTARGLYALNAENGTVAWRFDTELPLGNSPTVDNNTLYVAGYDRKLHALNALTGQHLWSFDGATAGYATNPLVINGKVYVGNRDGNMYAVGAQGTAQQGQLIWQYNTGGAILLTAAYAENTIYFASNDNYAYALNANTGNLVWRSNRLPGEGYQAYWPVIYRDKVIFATTPGYRNGSPGLGSVGHEKYHDLERHEIFGSAPDGAILGATVPGQSWAQGKTVLDGARITNYHEAKPWRRVLVALNRSNGSEYTFDSDADGLPEYIPAAFWGAQSGGVYPPIVGADDILYFNNIVQKLSIPQGRIMGWQMGTRYLSQIGGQGAIDEPQAISAGGNVIYRNLCCDRVGSWSATNSNSNGTLWTYHNPLTAQAPGYDQMWHIWGDPTIRLKGWYTGNTSSINAAYHNHGIQAAIIPYQGRLYVHRSNAIVAFGPGSGPGMLPLLTVNNAQDSPVAPSANQLRNRLDAEIAAILEVGHLQPGYYNVAQYFIRGTDNYFENPGDTLYALTLAYPHLSAARQAEVRAYLQIVFADYFDNEMYARIGWNNGDSRYDMLFPTEVEVDMAGYGPSLGPGNGFAWSYPQHNFYAMWKYAQIFPGQALTAYNLAKNKLNVPAPALATTEYFREKPYELNAWIAGYIGFLELQEVAGMQVQDAQLRTQVNSELNRLRNLRVSIFTKDSYWTTESGYFKKQFDVARNFVFLTPELAGHLRQNIPNQVAQAVDEYEMIAPYWFVSRYEASLGEGVMANLYTYNALFLAKALILQESRAEVTKYLDVPAFTRGDLLYIQNLVAAIEANP